ncbi:hypothetical protein J5X89_10330 [Vibrio sp. G41H]|uniref:hypothetical protein n=1 Tax=unclassified Vibrio TaxID=2614977 RepID=UPI001AD6CA96|nr:MULTISPECIES: hypothetical protein [unclassified Vibrio]MBO7912026.1 hypothetical protein [Vibrio sp. G41H]MCF7491603.1 hypothetical protein [Vibrio sp. G-C-1]
MSFNNNQQMDKCLEENPYVTFNSSSEGVSRLFDSEWDFTALKQVKKKLSFSAIDEQHRKYVQSCMFAVVEHQRQKSNSLDVTVSHLMTIVKNLNYIIRHWGKSDFSLLAHDREWKRLKRALAGKYSFGTLKQLSATINLLTDVGITNRVVSAKEYSKLKSSRDEKQCIAFPEAIHIQVLSQVVETVEKYHKDRHSISEVIEQAYKLRDTEYTIELAKHNVSKLTHNQQAAFNARILRHAKKLAKSIPDFEMRFDGKWLHELLKQCFICVALFSGARTQEILTMNKESYEVKQGIPLVSGLTSKGNDGQPIYTVWNTHPIVKNALEVAYDASQSMRVYHQNRLEIAKHNGDVSKDAYDAAMEELEGAFISCDYRGQVPRPYYRLRFDNDVSGLGLKLFDIQATEEDVEEFNVLNPDWAGELELGGTLPKLSPHDIRRSFAVFVVRNQLGNELTIKYQLKHKNLRMSRWYINYSELARTNKLLMDKDLLKEFHKAVEDVSVDALDDIYNVSDRLSGIEGEKIRAIKEKMLKKGEKVYMNRDELRMLLRSKEKALVILPTGGYCTSRDCERLCSMNEVTKSRKNCGRVVTDKGAKKMARERIELIRSFRKINELRDQAYSSLLSARKEKILIIEQTLTFHGIPYESFTDNIKAH